MYGGLDVWVCLKIGILPKFFILFFETDYGSVDYWLVFR